MKSLIASLLVGMVWMTSAQAQNVRVDATFAQANDARENGDIDTALQLIQTTDALHRDLFTWMRLRSDDGTFPEMIDFLTTRSDWPGLSRIRARVERRMAEEMTPDEILIFLEQQDVETGEGAVAYANALIAKGRQNDAEAMLIDIWLNDTLSDEDHQSILDAFPDVVAPHHAARADMLLWRWRTSDASNVIPLVDEGRQALFRARSAIINRDSDVIAREDLVPDRLADDAGLHYDRFNWFADRGDWTQATAILSDRSQNAETLGEPWRWGSWRRILARWQMREGNIAVAYRLAALHFIEPDQNNYSDLEWLAGYIALTYLKEYDAALVHFSRFDASVTSPISKGRAGYWLGRTYEGLGNAAAAVEAFAAGADHQTSFYGLLSAEKLGLTMDPDISGGESFGDWRTSSVLENDLVRAGLALLDAGERGLAVLFFAQAAETMSRQQIGQLGQLFMDIEEPFYAVLIAKTAVRTGELVQDVYFPIHPMAELDLPVEPALALAIARQESEFRTDAGSSVGALGLMQLMPATAQDVARWLDRPYSRGRLTSDWEYNAALGSEYLAYLTREFGDSPVMIAAGYNAGPSRPKSWMTDRGDPRRSFTNPDPVDVVDWIEHIPFRETRNYVMRVTEGIPVYRARLTGRIAPVNFTDILIGAAPVVRPVARPDRVQQAVINATPPVRRANELAPSAPSGPQPTRPVARAGD
ncbi:lytic transglycosylase domain-containing protein [Octadecabacter sp. G9-8]|uniref:Lytic transglycosylase domain-containing protein n=1 Tax=Octadecabacter dasysiphoniae TaxID=2909341 RepID=A0ABS9CXH9_9RHOB|nr:lytic transglycosylase domain-containing protein [Octadecabacter dasysiphoniae]MCF2871772.1 lytic transglycosylase domain-containing protein [Octadecabacter dasysiphoniae]